MTFTFNHLKAGCILGCIVICCCTGQQPAEQPRAVTPCTDSLPMHTGVATYYDFADGGGNCCFPPTPNDLMVGAMNHADYDNSYACGSCVAIDGPDSAIEIRIVDQCPECGPGHIDLSPLAFSLIAPIEQGKVPITWRVIPCPVKGPVIYHFKEGSNPWWIAVQVRNHRYPILTFEFLDEAGTFTELTRTTYNYFLKKDGLGSGPFIFRVTDIFGHGLIDTLAPPDLDNVEVAGGAQFAFCE
jgi:expansin (peptidoglycan-binding protein)